MTDATIRIYFQRPDGEVEDAQQDYGVEDFGGVMPSVGDMILAPGVLTGLDRRDPINRTVWTVTGRVLNPRDHKDYVALIVTERTGTAADTWL